MKRDIIHINFYDYLLVFLFVITCGFSSESLIPFKNYLLIILSGVYGAYKMKLNYRALFFMILLIISSLLIKLIHADSPTIFLNNFILNSIAGFFLFSAERWKFRLVFLDIMYVLAFISLICFTLYLFGGYIVHIPQLNSNSNYRGIFVYAIRLNEITRMRNCGPFWEPGAYAGYILITFMLFYEDLRWLYDKHRKKVFVLLAALLTTFSTQGYVIALLLILSLIIRGTSKKLIINIIPKLVVSIIVIAAVASTIPFMREKMANQLTLAFSWKDDESLRSANRFSTTMLDIYNISKSPLWGISEDYNKLYGEFSPIVSIYKRGGVYASGSGNTLFMAQYGILLYALWLILSYKSLNLFYKEKKSALLVLFLLIGLGQCEIYIFKIFFICLPYLFLINPPIKYKLQ